MPPTTSPADRAIYAASAALDKLISQASAFRTGLAAINLPIASANDRLDHSDDLIAILVSQLHRAAEIVNDRLEAIQTTEEVEYARAHGITALAEEARLVDRDFTRWTHTLSKPIAAPANDDALTIEGVV